MLITYKQITCLKKPCLLTEVFRKKCLVTDRIAVKILAMESDRPKFVLQVHKGITKNLVMRTWSF